MDETKKELKLYTLKEPMKWKAGKVGDREVFFDCGLCEKKAPLIYGYLGYGEKYEDIAVRQGADGNNRLLMLCEKCYIIYSE